VKKPFACLLLFIAAFASVPASGHAETRTISWSAVTTYTDNTPIESTKTVMYDVFWTTDATLSPASLQAVGFNILQTSRTFDPDALGIPRGQTSYFTLQTVLSTGEKSTLAPGYPWIPPTLSGVSISGPSSVNENGSGTYTATATWSDSSTTPVTPTWSEDSTFATISAAGVLTAATVTMDQSVTVTVSYTSGGVTKTASLPVTIVNVASPLSIGTASPLPAGTAGTAYNQTFGASGGTAPYSWSVTSGTLPAGLALSTAGVLSGTPTAAGISSFTVQVTGGGTATKAFAVTVNPAAVTLSGLSISGPTSVNEGSSGSYTATAIWSDNTTTSVAPIWSVSLTTYASITTSGVLTTLEVTGDLSVTVSANYTSGGQTRTATRAVTIVNIPQVPASPMNMNMSGVVQASPTKLFRLGWDPVTTYMDGTPIGTVSVRYSVYWTTDETLSVSTLRILANSIQGTSVTFDPAAEGMVRNQRVYLTSKAILATGEESPMSEGFTWVAINEGPIAPSNATIIKR
jgi:hypothetical protein